MLCAITFCMCHTHSHRLVDINIYGNKKVDINFVKYDDAPIDLEYALTYGFYAILAFTKASAEPANIYEWMKKRLRPLNMACKIKGILESDIQPIQFDLKYLGEVIDLEIELRYALVKHLLRQYYENVSASQYGWQVNLHNMMSWTGMTSFKLAYDFAMAASTEAHYFDEVCDESTYIIKQYRNLTAEYKNSEDYIFDYVLHGSNGQLQLRHYPHLVFCSQYVRYTLSSFQ